MLENKTPRWIVMNFCTGVWVHNISLITSANFHDYRLRGFGVAGGGQILSFSIDLRCRPYNVRVCDLLTSVDAA